MTKKDEQALLVFDRKIFSRIYGPKYKNTEWKSRTNRELEEMSKRENIVFFSNATTCPAWTLWFSSPGCGVSVTDF
jgi:hypothetical protein